MHNFAQCRVGGLIAKPAQFGTVFANPSLMIGQAFSLSAASEAAKLAQLCTNFANYSPI
jgi:hypothetical protein